MHCSEDMIPFPKEPRLLRVFFFVLSAVAISGCRQGILGAREPSDEAARAEDLVVKRIPDPGARETIDIPLPPNPYEEDSLYYNLACCCCEKACGSSGALSEFEKFVKKLKDEAGARTTAAADAVLDSGLRLATYDGWREIVRGCMDILNNPTLVIFQLPSGEWKKVKFEKVHGMDIAPHEVLMIQKSVGEKMKAALNAELACRGVPSKEAEDIAGRMIGVYVEKLFAG